MRIPLPVIASAACFLHLGAAEPLDTPATIQAHPTHVSRSISLWFEDGQVRGGQDGLQIGLHAAITDRLRVIDVEQVEIVEAIGDDGRALQASEHGAGGGGGGEPGQIDLSVMLTPPGPGVRSLRTLTVSIRVRVAAEGLRRATIQPAHAWIAKRMRIEGIDGGEVELEDLGADSLTIGMTPAIERALEAITCRGPDGAEVVLDGWNDVQEPGWVARRLHASLPADGVIRLDLRQELGSRTYRLTARDVPIALPDRSKQPVGVLKTEPIADDIEATPAPVRIDAAPAQP